MSGTKKLYSLALCTIARWGGGGGVIKPPINFFFPRRGGKDSWELIYESRGFLPEIIHGVVTSKDLI